MNKELYCYEYTATFFHIKCLLHHYLYQNIFYFKIDKIIKFFFMIKFNTYNM